MHESIAFTRAKDVKKTEAADYQRLTEILIFRIIGRERKKFSTDGLLVGVKFRINLTNHPFFSLRFQGHTGLNKPFLPFGIISGFLCYLILIM